MARRNNRQALPFPGKACFCPRTLDKPAGYRMMDSMKSNFGKDRFSMPRDTRRGMAAAAGGNVIFGFSFMFTRIALRSASPFVMLMYRFTAAFVLLALWARPRPSPI